MARVAADVRSYHPAATPHLSSTLFTAWLMIAMLTRTLFASFRPSAQHRHTRLYWNRATLCCAEVRAYLECDALPSVPCRGFSGDCADLPLQFKDIPGSGLEAYTCKQVG